MLACIYYLSDFRASYQTQDTLLPIRFNEDKSLFVLAKSRDFHYAELQDADSLEVVMSLRITKVFFRGERLCPSC